MALRTVSDIPTCTGCPMRELFPRNTFVTPEIIDGSNRLGIAEAPGEEEAAQGKPLVGGAGRIAKSLYGKANLQWERVSKINCIQCRPPDNVFPTAADARKYISRENGFKAVKQCVRNHVLPVLLGRAWHRLDLMGAHALYWIAGLNGIQKWRGSILEINTDEIAERVNGD